MNRLLHFIGIAYRAGKVQKGAFLTERAVKRGDAALVLIARDASQGTRDKFSAMCRYYGIPHFLAETKEALGEVTGGAHDRSVLALTDKGFAKRTAELLCEDGEEEKERTPIRIT